MAMADRCLSSSPSFAQARAKRPVLPSHPFGVKPFANALMLTREQRTQAERLRSEGLGSLGTWGKSDEAGLYSPLAILTDELLAHDIYIPDDPLFCNVSLRGLMVLYSHLKSHEFAERYRLEEQSGTPADTSMELPVPILSDVLYYSWILNNVDVEAWTGDNVERVNGISVEKFREVYDYGNKPVIITGLTQNWPAKSKWTPERLNTEFKALFEGIKPAGSNEWKFQNFYTHMYHFDRLPPYLGASVFTDDESTNLSSVGLHRASLPIEKPCPLELSDYQVPEYFKTDYFQAMGTPSNHTWVKNAIELPLVCKLMDSGNDRPAQFRWMLLASARSGSAFHQDPNFTAAWNISLHGRKKFVMFPGDVIPPGVEQLGEDDFRPPPIVIKWFLEFYHTLKKGTFYECVVNPGECIFVPSGWWHTVLNLDNTIAVTQNFVNEVNLPNSRFPERAKNLIESMEKLHPEVLKTALSTSKAAPSQQSESDWDALMREDDGNFTLG